jgi:hypothetical protein
MKLNKLERFTAYCILLAEAEEILNQRKDFLNNGSGGFCDILECILSVDCLNNPIEKVGLKELAHKKPHNYNLYWFSNNIGGWKQRIQLLKQCIKETHP